MRISRAAGGTVLALTMAAGTVPASASASAERAPTTTHTIPGDGVFPEGVAADPATGVFYVSGTTDGAVYRGDLRTRSMEVFLPAGTDGRTTAVGLKLDRKGRLYVAGGATGRMWVYDTRSRALIRSFDTGVRADTFINDLAFDRAGNAYFTDSRTPVLWRVPAARVRRTARPGRAQRWLDFTGTPLRYEAGFNLNGITRAPGGRSLLAVQSNTGGLFRIGLRSRKVTRVRVTGGDLTTGDGILMSRGRLLVVRHLATETDRVEGVVSLRLRARRARVEFTYGDSTFRWPTTAAKARGRLLVVNSQFDRRGAGPAELPFTVSAVRLPLR